MDNSISEYAGKGYVSAAHALGEIALAMGIAAVAVIAAVCLSTMISRKTGWDGVSIFTFIMAMIFIAVGLTLIAN